MKGLTQVPFCEVSIVLNREFPGTCFIRNQKRKVLSSPHLTPIVNMLRRCFPCNQPMSIIKPGGGKTIQLKKHQEIHKSLTCFRCCWRTEYATRPPNLSLQRCLCLNPQSPGNPHQQVLLEKAAPEHRGLSQLTMQVRASCPTHQLCQRRKE